MSRIKIRRATTSDWFTSNPVLAEGEPALDLDTGLMKLGNGVNAWDDIVPFAKDDRGSLAYASNETGQAQNFGSAVTAVLGVNITIPPTDKEVWVEWGAALGLVTPPVGNNGFMATVLYDITGAAFIVEIQATHVRSDDLAAGLFATHNCRVKVGPSTSVRKYGLYGLTNKDSGSSFPVAKFINNFGQQKTWISAVAR